MSFTALDQQDIVVNSDSTISPMWSNNTLTLNTFYTSSTQESSTPGTFYLDVYQTASNDANAAVQFSVAYGHISGSGSAYFNPSIPNRTPTRDIYGQFRTLIYGDENGQFTFGTLPSGSKDIIVLSVKTIELLPLVILSVNEPGLNDSLKRALLTDIIIISLDRLFDDPKVNEVFSSPYINDLNWPYISLVGVLFGIAALK